MNKLVKQIVRFLIIGGTAFLIDAGILYLLTDYLHIHYLVSSILSFTIAVIFNYIFSIKWVFEVKNAQTIRDITIFILLSVVGLCINQVVMYISVDMLAIYYMIAKIIATIIVMIYNFITRKLLIER